MFEIETPRSGFGVDDHGPRRDLSRSIERPVKGVKQEILTQSGALQSLRDGHPPKKRHRERKARQTLRQFRWQIGTRDGMRRESVKACDGPTVCCENKNRRELALQVLTGLLLQIGIKFRDTAAETRPIVVHFKRFNSQVGSPILTRHYRPARSL
jgi:hypothetical protein